MVDDKVKAVINLKSLGDVKAVQGFLEMVNFLGKYIPNRTEILKPITDRLCAKILGLGNNLNKTLSRESNGGCNLSNTSSLL